MVLSFSPLETDPRVNRQIRFLSESYEIIAVGYGKPAEKNVTSISVAPQSANTLFGKIRGVLRLLAGRFESYYWSNAKILETLDRLAGIRVDLIIANDIESLPLAIRVARGARVIFDAHEYSPREFEEALLWRFFFRKYICYLCNTYIPRVDGMMTVCQGIADAYEADTGLRPVVVTNAPYYADLQPGLKGNDTRPIRMVHHGIANASRKIENMIRMMEHMDPRFDLSLILVDSTPGYLNRLKALAGNRSNVKFLPPVPMPELPKILNEFDVGLFILEPVNFNYLHALPNKFFEFIQGRLAVAVGPSPEMARIVREHDLGVVAGDFSPEAMARCLGVLDHEKINYHKRQSHKVARLMSAEHNRGNFLDLVRRVLGE